MWHTASNKENSGSNSQLTFDNEAFLALHCDKALKLILLLLITKLTLTQSRKFEALSEDRLRRNGLQAD